MVPLDRDFGLRDWIAARREPIKWEVICKISGENVSCHMVGDDSFKLPFFYRPTAGGRETVALLGDSYYHRVFRDTPSGTEVSESRISGADAERIISKTVEERLERFGRAV